MSEPTSPYGDDEAQLTSTDDTTVDPNRRRLGRRRAARKAELADSRSFVERYQDTPWAGETPAPKAMSVADDRRILLKWSVVAGVVLVVLAVSVMSLSVMLGQKPPTSLSRFRDMTPAPVPTALPSDSGTHVPASPTAAAPTAPPPAQPWRTDAAHPATLFIAQMTSSELSFHLDAEVALVGPSLLAAVDYAFDLSGTDYASSIRRTALGTSQSADMVVIGTNYWGRIGDARWQSGAGAPPPANVLCKLTAATFDRVVYVGEETYRGKKLHHLQLPCARWPGPLDRAIAIVSAPTVLNWDIWVDDGGRARFAAMEMDATVRWEGADDAMTLSFDYQFSRFGKPIRIEVPVGRY